MNLLLSTMKSFIYLINMMCMIFGIVTICLNSTALENADPGTDEHAFLIVSIIMGAMLCMTTFFGCYGIVCEIMSVTIIYAIFMLMLLIIQYLQVSNFRPEHFQRRAMQKLDDAWSMVDLEPINMQAIESQFNCCALYSPRDYNYKRLATPASCYSGDDYDVALNLHTRGCSLAIQDFYQHAATTQRMFNRAMIISEVIVASYALVLCVIFYRERRVRRQNGEHVEGYMEPYMNHIGSRTSLLQH